ncbi:MAG: hypothetical protein ABSA70_16675 [Terriglobia bacterium]
MTTQQQGQDDGNKHKKKNMLSVQVAFRVNPKHKRRWEKFVDETFPRSSYAQVQRDVLLEYLALSLPPEEVKEAELDNYRVAPYYLPEALKKLRQGDYQGGELRGSPQPRGPVEEAPQLAVNRETNTVPAPDWLKGKIVGIDVDTGLPLVKRGPPSVPPKRTK